MNELTIKCLPHAGAHNPALIRWQGRTLMMYRVGGWYEGRLFLGGLDGNFQPVGGFREVPIPLGQLSYEDPRFFVYNHQLHFSFTAYRDHRHSTGIGIISDDLSVSDCRMVKHPANFPSEKNWIFFQHGEQLYFTYSMSDGIHSVCRLENDVAVPCFETWYDEIWKWGQVRGGTQLVAHEGLWYGFFHATQFNHEGLWKRYYMGAYAVAPEPPFPIVKMSRVPLFTPSESSFCGTSDGKSGGKMAVIFPSGLLFREGNWYVATGYNDHSIRMFEISHEELEASLASTSFHEECRLPDPETPAAVSRKISLVHFPVDDPYWTETMEVARKCIAPGQVVYAHDVFLPCFPGSHPYQSLTEKNLQGADWLIFHKEHVRDFGLKLMQRIRSSCDIVFANAVFVLFTLRGKACLSESPKPFFDFDRSHVDALWSWVGELERDFMLSTARKAGAVHSSLRQRSADADLPPRINVAILAYNSLEYTKLCLDTLVRYATEPFNIFILDNLSNDESADWLARQTISNYYFEPSPVNLGVSGGRNRLIEMTLPHLEKDSSVFFLDNDIEFTGPWQEPFLEILDSHPGVGIIGQVGYEILVHDDSRELLGTPTLLPLPVDIVTGFALWVRAETLREVGGFDEKLGNFWHDDDDYCVRAVAAGWEVFSVPEAPLIHHSHKSGATRTHASLVSSAKNQLYLAGKWREMGAVDDDRRIIHRHCAWIPRMNQFPNNDAYWVQVLEKSRQLIGLAESVFAPACFLEFFPGTQPYLMFDDQNLQPIDWIILHKDHAAKLGARLMQRIREEFHPVYANEVFVLFVSAARLPANETLVQFERGHLDSLWDKVNMLRDSTLIPSAFT